MNPRLRIPMGILLPEEPPAPLGGANPPVPAPPVERTFTQADVDRMTAEARGRAERSATTALVTSLGFANTDEAKAALTAAKAAADAQLSEQQRATAAAEAAKTAAEQAAAASRVQQHQLRIERALYMAGVAPVGADGTVNPAIAMAARLVDVDQAADDAAVTAAVAAVKTAVPTWFVPATVVPGTDPGPGPLPGQAPGAGTSLEEMRAVAARVHGITPDKAS